MFLLKILLTVLVAIFAFFDFANKSVEQSENVDINNSNVKLEILRKTKVQALALWSVIFIVFAILTSVFTTDAKQIACTTFLGKASPVTGSGIHFNVPFLGAHYVEDATSRSLTIGYDEVTDESQTEDSVMITSDFNLVNIDFYAEYIVSDIVEYRFGSNAPEEILRNELLAAIRNTVGQFTIDDVMTTGKGTVENKIFETVTKSLDERHIGIQVTNVSLQDSEPPTAEVQKAFTDVETARQDADQKKNEGEQQYKKKIPEAEAKANSILHAAEAAKTERVNQASEEVAKFNAIYKEYSHNPDVVKKRLYFDAVNEILPNMQIIIGNDTKIISVQDNTSSDTAKSVVTEEQVEENPEK